ncbi:Stk1 family PASTA domain-containing Ser/Thr kinase [Cellulomonas sp. APG4]|uniref:Stk1 family PASTA domain-containing Ser/Thr kinase n=1 Tax=Cellulomonas sp. APG4 TaxID=1538656 RepID=UPI00351AE01D
MDDAPRILGGRYEVGELIGRGGMAEVHIGHDTRLGRTVAIKILRSDLARDPSFQARFRREAQAAASLNHPAIVAVYDTGEDVFTEPGGAVAHVPFIVMEYVEGHTVRDILRDGSAVPIDEAAEITAGVLSALEYSHHAGIVHRDIKPANVMLTPAGAVKVMDFGIARAMADAAGTMTQTQAVIGTAQYLSPEQARGEAVDSRSDLYSTGCLLFELLTGRPPFIGDSPVAVAYQHAREVPQAPSSFASDVPESLDRITMKALAKDREDRYGSAAEFRADLEAAVRGGHVSAPALGAFGAGALAGAAVDQPTAATQVIGAGASPTQVAPAVMPWERTDADGPSTGVQPAVEDDEPKSRRWLVWTLVAVAVAAIVGIILILALRGDGAPETVEVPDVTNQTQAEAVAALEDVGLRAKPVTERSTDVEAGLVISTDPAAGEEAEVDSEVTVVVSGGPEAVTVPDLSGMTQDQARAALESAGLTGSVSVDTEDSPTVEEDRVTRSEPASGESVAPDAEITIFLSTGQVQLPDLTGLTEVEASEALTELGLRMEVEYEPTDEADPGRVLRQDRFPGPVEQRATVTVTVAEEPEPETVQVPDVFNLPQGAAEERLGGANLNFTVREEASDEVAEGRAIGTEPGAGASLEVGATVVLVISTGPAPEAGGPGQGEGEGQPNP